MYTSYEYLHIHIKVLKSQHSGTREGKMVKSRLLFLCLFTFSIQSKRAVSVFQYSRKYMQLELELMAVASRILLYENRVTRYNRTAKPFNLSGQAEVYERVRYNRRWYRLPKSLLANHIDFKPSIQRSSNRLPFDVGLNLLTSSLFVVSWYTPKSTKCHQIDQRLVRMPSKELRALPTLLCSIFLRINLAIIPISQERS